MTRRIKLEQREDGLFQASKPLEDHILESERLLKKSIREVKEFIKEKRKGLSFISCDVLQNYNSQILICYFVKK